MANATTRGASLGNSLQMLLTSPDIAPGDAPSYQTCKTLYLYHPLGQRIIDTPITMAMAKPRLISVPSAPEDVVTKAFVDTWKELKCDLYIANALRLARIYGISTLAMECDEIPPNEPIPPNMLATATLRFKCFDPLNTAGSLVLNQIPTSPFFQQPEQVSVTGQPFHPSRTVVVMNEDPIYLNFESSTFGFTGRSVFQRALYPLKSFISTMIADDMVARKCGVMVAKIKQPGSIVNNITATMFNQKRNFVKEAETNNVISIGVDEEVESMDLHSMEGSLEISRKHIVSNIAVATGIPEILLTQERMAKGFGEGSEDAAAIADFVDSIRADMEPLYDFFTKIVQRKAWTPEFYTTVQQLYPLEYALKSFDEAFYQWRNQFVAEWPELRDENLEMKLKSEKLRLDSVTLMLEKLSMDLDPTNKGILIEWAAENMNELALLLPNQLEFDMDAYSEYAEQMEVNQNALMDPNADPNDPNADPNTDDPDANDTDGPKPVPSAKVMETRERTESSEPVSGLGLE